MTVQWKKLVNFDVPQKLWNIAEKVAQEKGWTTEAVLCDAAEKYLDYVEKDPDNELISIQIPKTLYDRIERVGNKSVEREIEREMTEWVRLVEDIYEDSENEEEEELMLKNHILREVYEAVVYIPEHLEDSFIEGLISRVLPLLENQVDNKEIVGVINQLYRSNIKSRDNIKNILGMRGLSIFNESAYPGIERLVVLLKERVEESD
jgi:hypothetical protein